MTYKINDDQEVVIEATEEGQKEIKKDITLPEGQSTLTVVAKDATGNTTTYEKQIIASSKPTIEIISAPFGCKFTVKYWFDNSTMIILLVYINIIA